MRTALSIMALALCLALWLWGLLSGHPWPVTIALQAPGMVQKAFTPLLAPDPRATESEGAGAPPRPLNALLTPRAGTPQLASALACAPASLTIAVQDAFGSRRGLTQIAVGWPEREDGYGVLAPQVRGRTLYPLQGRGLHAPRQLTLTSLGGLFDGSGTLEVTARCDE